MKQKKTLKNERWKWHVETLMSTMRLLGEKNACKNTQK